MGRRFESDRALGKLGRFPRPDRDGVQSLPSLPTHRRTRMKKETEDRPARTSGKVGKLKARERDDERILRDETEEQKLIARVNGSDNGHVLPEGSVPIHALMPGERRTLFDARDAFPAGGFSIERPGKDF